MNIPVNRRIRQEAEYNKHVGLHKLCDKIDFDHAKRLKIMYKLTAHETIVKHGFWIED